MNKESSRLRKHINEVFLKYSGLDENTASVKLSSDKWSIKEIFGHLIDSAANNYQRFIRLQETADLRFPGYDYNWVEIVKYNSYPYLQILELWKQYNLLLCHIIENIVDSKLKNTWTTDKGNLSLEFLIIDYIDHLEIHIAQLDERGK